MPDNKEVVNESLNVLRTANARRRIRQEGIERGKFQPYVDEIAGVIAAAVTPRIIAALAEAGYIPGKLEVTADEAPPVENADGKKAAKKEVRNV